MFESIYAIIHIPIPINHYRFNTTYRFVDHSWGFEIGKYQQSLKGEWWAWKYDKWIKIHCCRSCDILQLASKKQKKKEEGGNQMPLGSSWGIAPNSGIPTTLSHVPSVPNCHLRIGLNIIRNLCS